MPSPLRSKDEKILIIESNGPFGERLRDALRKEGYEAKLVKNGSESLKTIYDYIPHLLVMDISLDGADAYDILEKKQAEPLLAKIPVFLLSSIPINMHRIPKGIAAEIFMSIDLRPEQLVQKVNRRLGNAMPDAPAEAPSGKKKIVWVEDDRLIGTILSKKLSSSGFDLFHAKNGEEALEILRSVIPDVIVLDLVLPGMSGFDILQQIRKDMAMNAIPVIILSNLSRQSDIERAKALGAKKFLVKAAVSLDQIVEEVRALSGR